MTIHKNREKIEHFLKEIEKVVIGRKETLKLLLTALFTKGHVLFEDLPGTGKTTMMKAFSHGLDSSFRRIQCTPDLLPSDVIGGSIFNPKTNEFYIQKGPVFTNVLLVDEINRALPRTQSSLLESMEENQVTIDGHTYSLEEPFIVLATQNPIDMEGTFPLPEAQMDRFLMRLQLGYPSIEEERRMLQQVGDEIPYDQIERVLHPKDIIQMQKDSSAVHVHEDVITYITNLAQATRTHPSMKIGVSPRATKALYRAVKSWAYIDGRDYVTPDDVKAMISPVWGHRITLGTEATMAEQTAEELLEELLKTTTIPKEKVIK